MTNTDLVAQLRQLLGAAHVLTDGDLTSWTQDWRKRECGRPLAVARPAHTAEVAHTVRLCASAGVPIVAQGGNTNLVVSATPRADGKELVLHLGRLQAIRHIDADNMSITVEAGCTLQAVQQAAENAGLLFPLSMGSEGSCTIGGNLATNAGGTQVLRYGTTRELCLGLEVVTAQGDVWDGLRGLRKDNTGYDLRDLFVGSEGTLGIITAAVLRLFPRPAACMAAWTATPGMDAAVRLLALARGHLDANLTGFEIMGRAALELVRKHFPHMPIPLLHDSDAPLFVLLESADSESAQHARSAMETLLEQALQEGCAADAALAENIAHARTFWHIRESITLAQAQEGENLKHDISIEVSRIPAFCTYTRAQLLREFAHIRFITYGHLGDGNLHYNLQAPAQADAARFLRDHEARISAIVYEAVAHFGGSFSAEHGVGSLKVHELQRYESPVALQMMRAIKQALDPQRIMNPGRVLRD